MANLAAAAGVRDKNEPVNRERRVASLQRLISDGLFSQPTDCVDWPTSLEQLTFGSVAVQLVHLEYSSARITAAVDVRGLSPPAGRACNVACLTAVANVRGRA